MAKMDTSGERRPRKKWPEALKREIVAATFFPGASVSIVSRQYDVNANQVFSWRRRYREAGEPPPSASSTPGLVPVRITSEPEDKAASTPAPTASETIEIDVSGTYRIRVGNGFDGQALRRVLDVLRRR
jgi:transposase